MEHDARVREAQWVAVLLGTVAAALVVSYGAYAFVDLRTSPPPRALTLLFAVRELAALAAVVALMRRYLGATLRDVGLVRPAALDVAIGAGAGVVLIGAGSALAYAFPQPRNGLFNAEPSGAFWAAFSVLVIGVWSPFVQEVFFRGALLRALRERFSPAVAVAASAIAFAVVHAASGTATVLSSGIDGVALGAITLRRRSLIAAITAHVLINTLATLALLHHAGVAR